MSLSLEENEDLAKEMKEGASTAVQALIAITTFVASFVTGGMVFQMMKIKNLKSEKVHNARNASYAAVVFAILYFIVWGITAYLEWSGQKAALKGESVKERIRPVTLNRIRLAFSFALMICLMVTTFSLFGIKDADLDALTAEEKAAVESAKKLAIGSMVTVIILIVIMALFYRSELAGKDQVTGSLRDIAAGIKTSYGLPSMPKLSMPKLSGLSGLFGGSKAAAAPSVAPSVAPTAFYYY